LPLLMFHFNRLMAAQPLLLRGLGSAPCGQLHVAAGLNPIQTSDVDQHSSVKLCLPLVDSLWGMRRTPVSQQDAASKISPT
jgi:hypothetical protein